jgi:hypothetical protein
MNTQLTSIEDCLETLAGLKQAPKFEIIKEDFTIVNSIARQVFKGTPLTDRQFELMKTKLEAYSDQFAAHGYDTFALAVETLRQPLRHIDRSKYIKIVSHNDMLAPNSVYESYKQDWLWIKVRFPFSKKLIVDLQSIPCLPHEHIHEKGSHEHFFHLTERNAYNVVNTFKDKNFNIEQELLDYYDKVAALSDEASYAPSIKNFEFCNVHPNAQSIAIQELGTPCADNIVRYKDRQKMYGIRYFDSNLGAQLENESVLTQRIVKRTTSKVFVKKSKWSFDNLVSSLFDLDRLPLVILLDENDPYDHLTESYNAFKNLVTPEQVSVQFRLSAERSNGFNEYIKDQGLNTPVDKDTKIVYTSVDKLNKPLLTSDCKPRAVMLLESRRTSMKLNAWLNEFDLVIHYDENISQFMRFQRDELTEV